MSSSPQFDISKSASLSDLESYSHFSIQEQKEKSRMPLHAIGTWTKSVVSATAPDRSHVRVSAKTLDQQAQQKFKELDVPLPANCTFEEGAKILKDRLSELSIIRSNLGTHDKVIEAYNKRFIFKGASLAACATHDVTIRQLDELKSKLSINLQKRRNAYKDEVINNITIQVLNGMPIDRDFMRNIYPDILRKFDQFPPKERTLALDQLHQVLNTGYVATLNERLVNDYRSVLPMGLEVVLKKFDLGHLLEGENIEKAVQFMSHELSRELNRDDLGSVSLPDYIELLNLKFLAYGEQLIREKIPDEAQRDAFLLFMKENHQIELQLKALYDKPNAMISRDELKNKISLLWAQTLQEVDNDISIEQLNEVGLDRICDSLEEALKKYDPRTELVNLHKKQTKEQLLSPDYPQKMRDLVSKKRNWNEYVVAAIDYYTIGYITRIRDWETKNKKYQNFEFKQGRGGSDYVLGNGCCWAISLDWHKRLKVAGKNIPDYATFMNSPSEPSAEGDKKITTKEFAKEVQKNMEQSLVTARMRRLQAQSQLESHFGNKSQDVVAVRLGYDTKDYTDKSDSPHNFLNKLVRREETAFKKGEITSLSDEAGILEVSMLSEEGGHRLQVQVNFKENIFRLIDSNGGMWTYPDKETFLKEGVAYLEAAYPNFKVIKGILYSEKKKG